MTVSGSSNVPEPSGADSPLQAFFSDREESALEHILRELARVRGKREEWIQADTRLDQLALDSIQVTELALLLGLEDELPSLASHAGDDLTIGDICRELERIKLEEKSLNLTPAKSQRDYVISPAPQGHGRAATRERLEHKDSSITPDHQFGRREISRRLYALDLDRDYIRGAGDLLWARDKDGAETQVLDLVGGYGANIFGHNHPEIVEVLIKCLSDKVPFNSQASMRPNASKLAAALHRRMWLETGEHYSSLFYSTGSEAVEAALRHAHVDYSRRLRKFVQLNGEPARILLSQAPVLLAYQRSFHGRTAGAAGVTCNDPLRAMMLQTGPLWAQPVYAASEEELRILVESHSCTLDSGKGSAHWARIAGIILEPIRGEGGIHPLNAGFLHEARRLADTYGFPLILDEIKTGMGRCGTFLANAEYSVQADYYLLGKSLGGGISKISALLVRSELLDADVSLHQISTFAEDDHSALVGLKALQILERDNIPEKAKRVGQTLERGLRELATKFPSVVRDVRGRGCMLGIELQIGDRCGPFLNSFSEDLGFLAASYLLRRWQIRVMPTMSDPCTLRLEPSAYLSSHHCELTLRALEDLVLQIERGRSLELIGHLCAHVGLAPEGEESISAEPKRPRQRAQGYVPRVAFLSYLAGPEDLSRWDPSLEALTYEERERLLERLTPFAGPRIVDRYPIRSATGAETEFTLIGLPLTSRGIKRLASTGNSKVIVDLVSSGITLARDEGCSIIGLGGYLSILTDNGRLVAQHGIGVTTGNSLTVAAALQALRASAGKGEPKRLDGTVAIVGSGGNIGAVCASLLASEAQQLVLVCTSRSRRFVEEMADRLCGNMLGVCDGSDKAAGLARRIDGFGVDVGDLPSDPVSAGRIWRAKMRDVHFAAQPIIVTEDLHDVRGADYIVTASSSPEPILFPQHITRKTIAICDVAVPGDVSPSVIETYPEIVVLDGACIQLPSGRPSITHGRLPDGYIYACMAETMLLGLEGYKTSFSLGPIEHGRVSQINDLARKHGFFPATLERQSKYRESATPQRRS